MSEIVEASCVLCDGKAEQVLDLGRLPFCNRFPSAPAGDEGLHAFVLAVCGRCALLQLSTPASPAELRPREDWISYSEPESHLDAVAQAVAAEGQGDGATILGLTEYDAPLLERLQEEGGRHGEILDWRTELNVGEGPAGMETLQARLTPPAARDIADRRGRSDLVLARYVLEHAHAPGALLDGLMELVAPGGRLLLEVPDCEAALLACDYSVLWEEHVSYFTSATLDDALRGRELTGERLPSGDIPAIVSLVRRDSRSEGAPAAHAAGDRRRALAFGSSIADVRARWRGLLSSYAAEGRSVGLFGAGHTGTMFVNALEIGPFLSCAIDDHPAKQGRFTPGARLPIVPSMALAELDVCLLALGPDAEDRVVAAHRDWVEARGRFHSISPASPRQPLAGVRAVAQT